MMSTSKLSSQQLITDSFSHQKSSSRNKGKVKQAKHVKTEVVDDVKSVDDPIRRQHLEELRQFDLDWRFGPCTGITRLERWTRAESRGQRPPQEVRDLLLAHRDDEEYVQNIWSGYPL